MAQSSSQARQCPFLQILHTFPPLKFTESWRCSTETWNHQKTGCWYRAYHLQILQHSLETTAVTHETTKQAPTSGNETDSLSPNSQIPFNVSPSVPITFLEQCPADSSFTLTGVDHYPSSEGYRPLILWKSPKVFCLMFFSRLDSGHVSGKMEYAMLLHHMLSRGTDSEWSHV